MENAGPEFSRRVGLSSCHAAGGSARLAENWRARCQCKHVCINSFLPQEYFNCKTIRYRLRSSAKDSRFSTQSIAGLSFNGFQWYVRHAVCLSKDDSKM